MIIMITRDHALRSAATFRKAERRIRDRRRMTIENLPEILVATPIYPATLAALGQTY
jgi:hypothetical protein